MAQSSNKGIFEKTQKNFSLSKKPTTMYNPQSNGIIERMHQVIGNLLLALDISKSANPPTIGDDEPWDNILSSVAWAIRSTYNTTLEATPGQQIGLDSIFCD